MMPRHEKLVGEEVESQLASLLRLWGFTVTVHHSDGYDLLIERRGLPLHLEVKGMRDWNIDHHGRAVPGKRRGRPMIRTYTHERLLEQDRPAYAFCRYRLDPDSVAGVTPSAKLGLCLAAMFWTPAHHIQVEWNDRAMISARYIDGLHPLNPLELYEYMRGDIDAADGTGPAL